MQAWVAFAVCLLLIGVAGVKLSQFGDVIAVKTGLGGTWVGLIMLATVTSLPELATGVTSVTAAEAPDIAVGDVLGSCVFNLLIIAALDFLHRGESIYFRASQGHILSGAFGVLLIGFIGFSVVLSTYRIHWQIGHLGFYTPIVLIIYLIAIRTIYRYERRQIEELATELSDRYPETTLKHALIGYTVAGLVVVSAGVALPFVAKTLAVQMAWSQSFVGTLFVAFATSLPEIVVTVAALRLGALDMAIANLFGSNLFNILVLVVDDALYLSGPLLSDVTTSHALSALSAMMMTGVVIVGILYRPKTRVFKTIGWTSLALVLIYALNTYALYLHGGT